MMSPTQIQAVPYVKRKLEPTSWQQQRKDHRQRISELIDDYLERRSHQRKDPVMDFLFEYYAFRPSYLKSWTPGLGTLLLEGSSADWRFEEMAHTQGNCYLDITYFDKDRISAAQWILDVLQKSADSKPSFGCFGMHEWAMVYKADRVRHDYLSLRMEKDELAEFVESRPLVCTHFDDFRFLPMRPSRKTGITSAATTLPTWSSPAACIPTWICINGPSRCTPGFRATPYGRLLSWL